MSADQILRALEAHSLLWVFFLAILEGPIVTVGAGWLARLGNVDLPSAFVVLVAADLVGDLGLYALGRSGLDRIPPRLRRWMRIHEDNVIHIARHFREKGGRTLVIGKLTHSLGFAVLIAAGVGKMTIPAFLWYNFLGTVPKTLFFLSLGYLLGHAFASIDVWIWRATIVLLVICIAAGLAWIASRRGGST